MTLSPVEIRHIAFPQRLLGFKRSVVERALGDVAQSFEAVWRDRADLADKVEHLEGELSRYRELEALLHTSLVSAQRTAAELKEQAEREADTILVEAHAEARRIVFDAHERRTRLLADIRRLKTQLESALAALGEEDSESGEDSWTGTGEQAA